jgi:hypothetical protein
MNNSESAYESSSSEEMSLSSSDYESWDEEEAMEVL